MIDAIGLNDTMSKQEIFANYANDINFGNNAYGLYTASQKYFGKSPSKLNDGELTMLAGIPNAPNDYNPLHSFILAKERQKIVVDNMVDAGYINQTEADTILKQPIRLKK